jgi:tetratricopeptide (TPR) repeat protein
VWWRCWREFRQQAAVLTPRVPCAGKYPEAIKSYNRALELCPANQDARVARGAAQANQHSYADAIADFEAVLQQDPKNQNAASYLAAVRVAAEAHRKAGAAASRHQSKENAAAADAFWHSLDAQDPAVLPGEACALLCQPCVLLWVEAPA